MKRIIYNTIFPVAFTAFLPGMLWKLWRRPGHKENYAERFSLFSAEQKKRIQDLGNETTWIHSVSVGETQIAVGLIRVWRAQNPNLKIILSTTTTTGQDVARKQLPAEIPVIFCPLDFFPFIRKAVNLIRPKRLVILETEIWPELIYEVKRIGAEIFLVNGRMSDKSSRGYHRFAFFFAPILKCFTTLCVQTEADKSRYKYICGTLPVTVTGNMKFDQTVPQNLKKIDLSVAFGPEKHLILLAASTHPGEEKYIAESYVELRKSFPDIRLIIVPRHAERGAEIEKELSKLGLNILRRSNGNGAEQSADVYLADTTGEMLSFIAEADVVIMGKSLAGHHDGHNLIEPALLAKPVVTGSVLKNFRFVLDVLRKADAVLTVTPEDSLSDILRPLLSNPDMRQMYGDRARAAITVHEGATQKTIAILEKHT